MSPYHPLAWVARVNPLRWFVEGVVCVLPEARSRTSGAVVGRGGFARASSSVCCDLVVLITFPTDLLLPRAPEEPFQSMGSCGGALPEEEEEEDLVSSRSHRPPYTARPAITDEDFAPVVSGASLQIKSGVARSSATTWRRREFTKARPSVLVNKKASRGCFTRRERKAAARWRGCPRPWTTSMLRMLDARSLVAYAAKLSGHDESHVACLHLCGVTHGTGP